MKLLLDQNLSWKLVSQLEGLFPGTAHVKAVLSTHASDEEIWFYALTHDFIVVSKDDDFEQRSILLGHPPKVIWIRLGNCRTQTIADLLTESFSLIAKFVEDNEKSLFPLP